MPAAFCFWVLPAAAGQPVVYVATGTIVVMRDHMVRAMAEGLAGVPGARVLWSLKQVSGHQLPRRHALHSHLCLSSSPKL